MLNKANNYPPEYHERDHDNHLSQIQVGGTLSGEGRLMVLARAEWYQMVVFDAIRAVPTIMNQWRLLKGRGLSSVNFIKI